MENVSKTVIARSNQMKSFLGLSKPFTDHFSLPLSALVSSYLSYASLSLPSLTHPPQPDSSTLSPGCMTAMLILHQSYQNLTQVT